MVPMNTTPFILLFIASATVADEQRSLTLQKLLKYSNFISPSNSLNRSSNDSYSTIQVQHLMQVTHLFHEPLLLLLLFVIKNM